MALVEPVRTTVGYNFEDGGASFGMFNPLVAPESPDSSDIETWENLPAAWAPWEPGGGALPLSTSVDRGALLLDFGQRGAGLSPAMSGVFTSVPSASEWSAVARITLLTPRTPRNVFVDCGFGVAEDLAGAPDTSWVSAANLYAVANDLETGAYAAQYAQYDAFPSSVGGGTAAREYPGSFWLRMRQPSPGNFSADYSTDGIRWQQLHSAATFATPAPPSDLVIFGRADPSGTDPGPNFRLVVGPFRVSTGPGSSDIETLIPAGR